MELPYIITFEPNNGEPTLTRVTTLTSPFVIDGDLPEVNRTRYQFLGWYRETSGGTEITESTEFSGNTTVYAQWELITYTVRFKNWDGTVIQTQTVSHGVSATAPSDPTRPETEMYTYTFSHWDKEFTNVTQNLDITAEYTENLRTYTIIWKWNNETGFTTSTQVAYNVHPTPPILYRTGYTLSGWTPEISLVTGEAAYTANWTPIYTITFSDTKGNSTTREISSPQNYKVNPLPSASANGFDFQGWYTATSGGDILTTDMVFNSNAAFYAQWIIKDFNIRFYDYDNLSVESFIGKYYGESIILPTPLTRPGYTFDGWCDNRNVTTYHGYNGSGPQITWTTVPDLGESGQEYNFYAKYTPKQYTLYFSHGGFDSSTVTYNEPYSRTELNSEPYPREGYTWEGWYDASSGGNEITSASLVEVVTTNNYIYAYARWTKDPPYTIIFEPNNGKPTRQTETLKRETTVSSPFVIPGELPDVKRTNFVFKGWYLDNESFLEEVTSSETSFDSNTTVYAKWDWQPKKDYKDFYFRNKSLSEFNGFIINGGDDLKFFNPSNFSHEFTTPQFSNRSFLMGTSRENREFNFNIFLQEVTLEQYKNFLDWLNPEYKGVLILSYNTDYGYDVKVNSLSEATFYVCRECEKDDRYNIELEIGFITEKDWAARILNEEDSLSSTIELKENNFWWYHEIINNQNLENYLIIEFKKSLEIIRNDYKAGSEGYDSYSMVKIVNKSPDLSATYYSQYGIAILENGDFLDGTIAPLVIPPKTSMDKYLIKIDDSEEIDGSIKMTSREII